MPSMLTHHSRDLTHELNSMSPKVLWEKTISFQLFAVEQLIVVSANQHYSPQKNQTQRFQLFCQKALFRNRYIILQCQCCTNCFCLSKPRLPTLDKILKIYQDLYAAVENLQKVVRPRVGPQLVFYGTISNWCIYQFLNFNFLKSILKSMFFPYNSLFHYFLALFKSIKNYKNLEPRRSRPYQVL